MESWSTKLSIMLSMSNKYSTFIFKFTNTQKTFVIKPFKPPWSPFEDVTLLFDVSNLWPLVFKKKYFKRKPENYSFHEKYSLFLYFYKIYRFNKQDRKSVFRWSPIFKWEIFIQKLRQTYLILPMFLPSQIANSLKNTSQTIRSDSKQGLTYSNVSKTSWTLLLWFYPWAPCQRICCYN